MTRAQTQCMSLAIEECREVEQTRGRVLLIGRWRLPEKSREREATYGCKDGHLGQCGGIRCPNDPTKSSGRHLNIIRCFKGYIVGIIVEVANP